MREYVTVLSIAGSDSSGGAGIQADIKTISSLGCYAMTALTAVTAQNTCGVTAIQGVEPSVLKAQLDQIISDIPPLAIKTGMLYSAENVNVVADFLNSYSPKHLVVDPVMISTSGSRLISEEATEVMKKRIFPVAHLITPNKMEAEALTGETEAACQIEAFRTMGCKNILIKGGDSEDLLHKTDFLSLEGDPLTVSLHADAVITNNTHGTGCTLSSAIACYLALGFDMESAVCRAKLYVTRALQSGASVRCGSGHGPLNHLFQPRRMKFQFKKRQEWK